MKTTLYWTVHHIRFAWQGLRFRAACWWLSRQVEFLTWRLRVEVFVPSTEIEAAPVAVRQGNGSIVHLL